MKGYFKRLEKAEGMRDDTVEGEFYNWPEIGKAYRFYAFNGVKMRLIETSHVTEIVERGGGRMVFRAKDGAFEIVKMGD